ncbi:hypothetical protein [Kitasatospora sp. NPDC056531]|uniref:hypothetical protein n=1 Tax=Kitasatospora sp. NPDC056531 TaxID=3345856 RepID=UPI0036778C88
MAAREARGGGVGSGGKIDAQALLDATVGATGSPDWSGLVRAHEAEPLPVPARYGLADRPDVPDALARAVG